MHKALRKDEKDMRRVIIGVSVATILALVDQTAAIPVPSGVEPIAADTRFDAVCGVGRKHLLTGPEAKDWFDPDGTFNPLRNGGMVGSGTLIAPDLVLTARHLFPPDYAYCVASVNEYLCAPDDPECPSRDRRWVVRFRRNLDGTVGTMGEDPIAPHTVRGPASFHHVEVESAIELPQTLGCTDSIILVLAEPVTHIDPIPLVGADHRLFRFVGLNEPTPWPILGTHQADIVHDLIYVGWGSSTPDSSDASGSGQLRVRFGGEGTFSRDDRRGLWSFATGDAPVSKHDSGSPVLLVSDAGSTPVVKTVNTIGTSPGGWAVGGRAAGVWVGDSQIAGRVEAPVWFDVTGSPHPLRVGYGVWDGRVDLDDVLYVAAETTLGNPAVDFTGSADPNDPAYGVPDGMADSIDYAYFVAELSARPASTISPWSPLPLPARGADTNGDGRFTAHDFNDPGLTALDLAPFDFDRNGQLGNADLARAQDIEARFGHGLVADLDGDGDTDTADLQAIITLLGSENPWAGQRRGDPGYRLVLDSNLDGHTTIFDRRDIAARFLPGEVADATSIHDIITDPLGSPPDFVVTRWDRLAAFWELIHATNKSQMLDTSGSGDPASDGWGVPDQVVDGKDLRHFLYRQHEVFGPGGQLEDPAVTVRMWPALDADGSGRLNHLDFEYLQGLDPTSPEAMLWDLDGDGVFEPFDPLTGDSSDAIAVFYAVFAYGWNQGLLGDFDGDAGPTDCCVPLGSQLLCLPSECAAAVDASPDCDDYWAIYEAIRCNGKDLFDGRAFFSDANEGYLAVLDADLDGDNDSYDQYQVLLVGIGSADLNLDGVLDVDDTILYLELFNEGNLGVDIVAPHDAIDNADLLAYLNMFQANVCGIPTTFPRPCP